MIKNYINGALTESVSCEYIDNYDPSKGEAYGIIPDSDERDIELAVNAAEKAFPLWSETSVEQRSEIMLKIASFIERDLGEFARAECVDNGKPLALARNIDMPRAVKNFEFFASAIINFSSESHSS